MNLAGLGIKTKRCADYLDFSKKNLGTHLKKIRQRKDMAQPRAQLIRDTDRLGHLSSQKYERPRYGPTLGEIDQPNPTYQAKNTMQCLLKQPP